MKSKDDYDQIDGVDMTYVSYVDGKITTEPVEKTREYSGYLLHFGLLLHLLKIQLDTKLMMALMIIVNLVF